MKGNDRMNQETIKRLVDIIPEDDPLPDELEAIRKAKADASPTVPHNAINWN